MYGGTSNGECLSDFWEFDLKKNVWKLFDISNSFHDVFPRSHHFSFLDFFNDFLYVFGGYTDFEKNLLDDCLVIDLRSFSVKQKIVFPLAESSFIISSNKVRKK